MRIFTGTRPFFNSVEEMNEWLRRQREAASNQTLIMDKVEYPTKQLPVDGCECPKPTPDETLPQKIFMFGWHCPVHSPRL